MLIPLLIANLISVVLAYLSQRRGSKLLLYFSAFILSVIYGIRYDFGNDYWNYVEIFKGAAFNDQDRIELGWFYLNKIFSSWGFFSFVFCLTIFQIFSIYYFIAKYVERSYWWFAIAIFTGTFNYLLLGCSMMRQFTAMIILFYSIRYIVEQKFLPFVLIICAAILVHKTAIVFAPMYILGKWTPHIEKTCIMIIYMGVVYVLFIFAELYIEYLKNISLFMDEEHFSNYLEREGRDFCLTAMLDFIWLFLLMRYNPTNITQKVICIISIISFIILPFTFVISLLLRIMLYFSIFYIFSIPNMVAQIKNRIWKFTFIAFYLCLMIRRSFSSLSSETYYRDYEFFQTIFSANSWL